ncbi:hypothetical protein GCM10023170_088820 [Phytohabitans houttuyneae]|uniref:Uncharacterized protein n=1 Tax=Phytohabitans houttuyneae TaxID=1076126 RepID=A0A6V8K9M4_9ACTN|nr:hypothetical protein Phou_016150 [Phytohabitans houttuyneae]
MTCPPAPLAFDGRGFEGLPDRLLALDELKSVLLSRGLSRQEQDVVWRELVERARRDGPAWVIACVGVAMPGLRRAARRLAADWMSPTVDLHAEVLEGFLIHLRKVDLSDDRIVGKLVDAGKRRARKARDADADASAIHVNRPWSRAPLSPWDHPDWILTRAVAAGVIDVDEHALIAKTRLEGCTLATVAAELGISASLAGDWRRKAQLRLADAIRAGELDHVRLDAYLVRHRRRLRAVLGVVPVAA